ncbi:dehydrogenase [Auriculariales sp. MPI-PUGE-AT-0066]|nr:dehydrogenase [Auriculariales sp. MPI-PUGE-AT-0066]
MARAVFLAAPGKLEVRNIAKPTPGPAEVLIRVHAAALNPTDVKHLDNFYPAVFFDTIAGCDFAGVVEEVGSEVPTQLRKVGERVAGAVHGATSPTSGAFADYVVTDPRLLISLPDATSFEDAAGLSLCGLTAFQMLYQSQDLSRPQLSTTPKPVGKKILVWSGASAVGQLVTQVAASAGLEVIAAASPRHREYLKSLGASAVFNYADSDAFGDAGGIISTVGPAKTDGIRPDIKAIRSIMYTTFGKDTKSPYVIAAEPNHYTAALEYYKTLAQLLSEGRLKTTSVKLFDGFDQVQAGFDYMKSGNVSAEKVTFKFK